MRSSDAPCPAAKTSPRLATLLAALSARGDRLDALEAGRLLGRAELDEDDVAPFVEESALSYARRRVARTERFEVLVMTWRPGQESAPHDHAGSACALRVMRGRVRETRYDLAGDGLVDPRTPTEAGVATVVLDPAQNIHALANDAGASGLLVTLHIYAPPLPELRRYAARPSGAAALPVFSRPRHPEAELVAVVGGGFSGTLVAAHLVRRATEAARPLHVVLVDKQAAFGEGPAYRTADPRHLLNVPAGRMSAWPDRPDSFLAWAKARDPAVGPGDFLPRRVYGEYVRASFFEVAAAAGEGVTVEIRQDDVRSIAAPEGERWRLTSARSAPIAASAVVLATGHRPPDDPLAGRWEGSRARFIADPWASLTLSAIGPDEPIVLLGSGLTAIDVLLTVARERRTAPVLAISRRGMFPAAHAAAPVAAADLSRWVDDVLTAPGGVTARGLLTAFLREIDAAIARGEDWRSVVDGVRPHTARLWGSLSTREASRFLRHVRSFWEVRRHRMAPRVASLVRELSAAGLFQVIGGRILAARGDAGGVTLDVRRRGAASVESLHTMWIVNCTGPGDVRSGAAPAVTSLIEAGLLQTDPLGLGVMTGPRGEAVGASGPRGDLVVVGTLRKPQSWESTAVPELRVQAERAADAVMQHLARPRRPPSPIRR